MSRASELREARASVVGWLKLEVRLRTVPIAALGSRGTPGDAYRREIARLWRVALRAVIADSKKAKR